MLLTYYLFLSLIGNFQHFFFVPVFCNYMRKCLGSVIFSVYWKNCFSLKIRVSVPEKIAAAFLFLIDSFMFFPFSLPEMCVIWMLDLLNFLGL